MTKSLLRLTQPQTHVFGNSPALAFRTCGHPHLPEKPKFPSKHAVVSVTFQATTGQAKTRQVMAVTTQQAAEAAATAR